MDYIRVALSVRQKGVKMIAIDRVEIFRAGDYGPKGKFTHDDIDSIIGNFDKMKEDFPVTVNQIKAHRQEETKARLSNAPAIGWGKKLYRSGDLLMADLSVNSDFHELLKKRMYDKRSVGLTRNDGKLRIDHLEFLGKEWPEVKGLKTLGLSLYAESEDVYMEFCFENTGSDRESKKEKNMSDLKFSQEYVDLEVIKAREAREKELNIEFSEKLAEKEAEIADYKKRVEQLDREIEKKDEKLLEFSEKQKQGEHQVIRDAVERAAREGKITKAEVEEKISDLIHFSESGKGEWVDRELGKLERAEPLIEFSGISGNRGKVGADDDLDTYEIDISAQAEKAGEK